MQPLKLISQLKSDMIEYISSKYPFFERGLDDLDQQLRALMSKPGTLFQDPVIQLVRRRQSESFDASLFESSLVAKIKYTPYSHQIKAWKRISAGLPTVVATGTGSGKSESFMFPMIDGLVKAGFAKQTNRVGAICLYPMNALVEDQFFRFLKLAADTGIKVGIYNGTYKRLSAAVKNKILDRIKAEKISIDTSSFFVDLKNPKSTPHILLTNYKMLEYMLLRTEDHQLFAGADLRYLVLDEAHTYTGTLGLEIACLLARLRVHLGPSAENFVPIATSATLMQASSASANEAPDQPGHIEQMRMFFSQLFGKPFPKDQNWLIEDEFVPLPAIDATRLQPFVSVDASKIRAALAQPFPIGLEALAETFGLATPTGAQDTGKERYQRLANSLHKPLEAIAGQLSAMILCREDESGIDPVVSWSDAVSRFKARAGGSETHLEALLILASQAYQDENMPTLGLRLHLFGRAEPRVYWNLSGTKIIDQDCISNLGEPSAAFMSCRRCGHMAWAGIYTPTDASHGQGGYFDPLPVFYENAKLESGAELIVLHRPEDIMEEVVERKNWDVDLYSVIAHEGRALLRLVDKKKSDKAIEGQAFVRVRRKDSGHDMAKDTNHCPSCGGTAGEDDRAILMTPRSGAATDLGIYASSIMTSLDVPSERRLLIFSDNRQETSFLSGFLTDRHRRLNLRRIIASFLKAATDQDGEKGHSWKILQEIDEDDSPKGHQYDFAARVLLSLHEKKYWGRAPLPRKLTVAKRLLQEIIPRDVLEVDYLDRKDIDRQENIDFKNWLLGNISQDSREIRGQEEALKSVEVFGVARGIWALRTLHEVILMEISAMTGREGNLRALGLASWAFPSLSLEAFTEWATDHPELGLSPRGLMAVSQWLLGKLAENAQWQSLDDSSRRHVLGRRGGTELKGFPELLGKGFDNTKGISKNSGIGRLLMSELGSDAALKVWSKIGSWVDLIENGPLRDCVALSDGKIPRLKTKRALIISNPVRYRGNVSGAVMTAPAQLDFKGLPTGRKNEVWGIADSRLHEYYRSFYQRSFQEEARLVRAHEHNGMIGGELASEVIEAFSRDEVNTLVATPTLEMGVDLPDLPAVLHRSVPPDASNYAQRSGRAGRGPKRALILTHCGFGSHDLTFYEDPKQMVSGEILPPGLPAENVSIIKRHVHGLVLEILARRMKTDDDCLSYASWGELVDLNPLRTALLRVASSADQYPTSQPQAWADILTRRQAAVEHAVSKFAELLESGLWSGLPQERRAPLRQGVLGAGQPARWAAAFRAELTAYYDKCKDYLDDFMRWHTMPRPPDDKRKRLEIDTQMDRAYKLLEIHLKGGEEIYPLSYLGISGFLPNFDFPGKSIRFVGVLPQFAEKGKSFARNADKFLSFTRSAAVALREFAPEQKVYGQGFIYRVDRYETDSRAMEPNAAWGICLNRCTELSEPGASACQFCGGELVSGSKDVPDRPVLIEISGAQGLQAGVISDREGTRSFNAMVKELRHRRIPEPDQRFMLDTENQVTWSLHLSQAHQVTTASVLAGQQLESAASGGGQRLAPLYREVSGEESRVFRVRAVLPAEAPEGIHYQQFLPTIWAEGQALVCTVPFSLAEDRGWIFPRERSEDEVNKYYVTFAQLISRAATRVLRLNKRKGSLQFLDHRVNEPASDGSVRTRERSLMIIDTEEGGSGVIPLLWTYWDDVMRESARLAIKSCCQNGCYACVKSYDNQYEHALLDKALFYSGDGTQRDAPLFGAITKAVEGKLRIREAFANREQSVDPRSPAESVLEQILSNDFGHARSTQQSVRTIDGREITRPDFTVASGTNDDICIYVDGWTYHQQSILEDMHKRNKLAKQHQRVMAIPARFLTPKRQDDLVFPLLQLLKRTQALGFSQQGPSLSALPFAMADKKQQRDLAFGGLKPTGWQMLDQAALKGAIKSALDSDALMKVIDQLAPRHWPVAIQKDHLLWPLYVAELEGDKSTWEAVLVLQSVLSGLGLCNLFIEAKTAT